MPRNYPGDLKNVYLCAAAAFDITGSGIFIVADSSRKDIVVLNPGKDPIHTFGGENSGDRQARTPGGLAYSDEGTVYVTDKKKNQVAAWKNSGWDCDESLVFGKDVLLHPEGVTVDDEGNVIVADSGNNRIVVFSKIGNHVLRVFGNALCDPSGVEIHNGNIVVADRGNNRIVFYSAKGAYMRSFGREHLLRPSAVTVHIPTGNIVVADTYHHRIVVFSAEGEFLESISTTKYPTGVKSNDEGMIFVICDTHILYRCVIYECKLSHGDYDISTILATSDGKKELENWECAICMEGINEGRELASAHEGHKKQDGTQVVHTFHRKCLQKWNTGKCPTCKIDIDPKPLLDRWVAKTTLKALMGENPFIVANTARSPKKPMQDRFIYSQ
jgi:sugar lactone lactonase YvrE